MAQARIIFHLPGSVLLGAEPLKPYYQQLREGLQARGAVLDYVIHDRDAIAAEVAADEDFHIVDHGSLRHPRALNTGIAYVYPFWHLDPWGIRAASSITAKLFDKAAIDPTEAWQLMQNLRKWQVAKRTSRYPQPEAVEEFPKQCIAVFLQSEAHRGVMETCYLDRDAMLGALLARDDPSSIVVKIHPRDHSEATREWLAELAARDTRLRVTEANIHDILARAKVSVTINSAVGLESMIHRVPVVLCGQADFHHCAQEVKTPPDMGAALHRATAKPTPYAAYLYWYFRLNCIATGRPSFIDDFLAKIAETGFDTERFGLR